MCTCDVSAYLWSNGRYIGSARAAPPPLVAEISLVFAGVFRIIEAPMLNTLAVRRQRKIEVRGEMVVS